MLIQVAADSLNEAYREWTALSAIDDRIQRDAEEQRLIAKMQEAWNSGENTGWNALKSLAEDPASWPSIPNGQDPKEWIHKVSKTAEKLRYWLPREFRDDAGNLHLIPLGDNGQIQAELEALRDAALDLRIATRIGRNPLCDHGTESSTTVQPKPSHPVAASEEKPNEARPVNDRFSRLRAYVDREMKGKEKRVLEALLAADGHRLSLTDVSLICEWEHDSGDPQHFNAWNSLRKRINDKIERFKCQVARRDGSAVLIEEPSGRGRKSTRKVPEK